MPTRAAATVVLASALTSACVMVPVTTTSYDPDCGVVVHHMALQVVQIAQINNCNDRGCMAVVIAGLGVTAASAIVSGSIVVAGNVAYWGERRAVCAPPTPVPD